MGAMTSVARLTGIAWALVRADAVLPREIDPLLPLGPRALGRLLRLLARRAARGERPGQRLAAVLERQGPVAIKLGQFLAARGDILGIVFAEDLSRLKDRLAPFPTPMARRAVEESLGRPVDSLFASFDEAVAAASLAQVHRATLLDGRPAAVKVLRPGIERRVAADSAMLTWVGDLAHALSPAARRLEPRAFAATVTRALQLELDLRFEAAGADELRAVMAVDDFMSAPRVVWDGVGRRVLTLEWAPGLPLSDAAALEQPGLDRPGLAARLVRAFLAQALDHGVFHADLHEGNLFVQASGALIAVDFGIIGRLGPGERRFLAEILWGFLRRDYARVAAVHFEAGYVPAGQDRAAFAQALRAVGEPIFGRTAGAFSMSRLLTQLFQVTAVFDMHLRPELVLLQKTMVTVEAVARRIDPEHDIWASAEPVVRRWIARELSPASRMRDLVTDLRAAAAGLAHLAAREAEQPGGPASIAASTNDPRRTEWGWLGLAYGAAIAASAFAVAALLR